MNYSAVAVVLVLTAGKVLAQSAPQTSQVVDVTWREVFDWQGNRTSVPVFSRAAHDRTVRVARVVFPSPELSAVVRVDEDLRRARLANDVQAMQRILSDDFFQTTEDGISRDRTETLQFWSTARITSLRTERATIRLSGTMAVMAGEQTGTNGSDPDHLLFTRIYVRSASNEWTLLSGTQFRNPK
jgi:hypothetical protein